jgi:hypothetical protein
VLLNAGVGGRVLKDQAAFNNLVQDGLIEVMLIEDGMPYYRIASEFANPA